MKKRSEVKKEDKWNLEAIFPTTQLWHDEYNALKKDIYSINEYKGKLNQSDKIVKKMIEKMLELDRRIDKLFTFAQMKHDEETSIEENNKNYDLIKNLFVEYDEISSWITPEFLSLDDEKLNKYVNSNILKEYKFFLEKLVRRKKHTLSTREELLLSMAGQIQMIPHDVFSSLNDSEIKFGKLKTGDQEEELSHSKYYLYLISKNRDIREKAFKQYHNKYDELPMTMANLLYGEVKSHIFISKARNFKSTLEASLFYKNIDISVYKNLISTVRKRIGALHSYLDYRKKKMKLDELHLYDVYVPFVEAKDIKFSYDEAREILLNAVKPLGEEYILVLKKGLYKSRWVDIYENENKRSGAYSSGSYDTMPYILLNYNGTLNSATTLAHEAGHSMHSYFSHTYQPQIYADYPIFVAEVASTFNEELFSHYLLSQTTDASEKAYLINLRIEAIRTTLFRQTMFAEFELTIHELVEKGIPLTNELLKKEYHKLNKFYFGDNVVIDKEIEIEWARIPHFYYNYYVYQYATGISAAIALANRVLTGGEEERDDYLNFLKSGSSKFPIDCLKIAGVDMSSPAPINSAIDYFEKLLNDLKSIY